jgi:hypothetical protein
LLTCFHSVGTEKPRLGGVFFLPLRISHKHTRQFAADNPMPPPKHNQIAHFSHEPCRLPGQIGYRAEKGNWSKVMIRSD